MKTELQWKVYFAEDYNETFDVVENGWVTAYIEKTCMTNKVVTYFYYTDSGSKLNKQQVLRKYFTDSKGTYINWHGQKFYFNF